jgi:hypothetical protein
LMMETLVLWVPLSTPMNKTSLMFLSSPTPGGVLPADRDRAGPTRWDQRVR